MTKVILKDVGALKKIIVMFFGCVFKTEESIKEFNFFLDQAFAEEEEKPWEPKVGEEVWVITTDMAHTKTMTWQGNEAQKEYIRAGLVYETRESAQQFLKDYKTFLSERVKNK